jgi:predicted RNase H-like nuclease (RuvC/YqgF family)
MKHNIRIKGKYATRADQQQNEVSKYKSMIEYLQSVMTGTYAKIRRLTEENETLKAKLRKYENCDTVTFDNLF